MLYNCTEAKANNDDYSEVWEKHSDASREGNAEAWMPSSCSLPAASSRSLPGNDNVLQGGWGPMQTQAASPSPTNGYTDAWAIPATTTTLPPLSFQHLPAKDGPRQLEQGAERLTEAQNDSSSDLQPEISATWSLSSMLETVRNAFPLASAGDTPDGFDHPVHYPEPVIQCRSTSADQLELEADGFDGHISQEADALETPFMLPSALRAAQSHPIIQ